MTLKQEEFTTKQVKKALKTITLEEEVREDQTWIWILMRCSSRSLVTTENVEEEGDQGSRFLLGAAVAANNVESRWKIFSQTLMSYNLT